MDVIVLGSGGLLGSAVVSACLDRSMRVAGTFHSDRPAFDIPLTRHDIRDADAFESLLDEWDPAAVVNCAALTDVDGCESRPDAARAINGTAPGELADACAARNVPFVHVSTDYVFDGETPAPYPETADPNPIQVYGESKLAGERRVRDAGGETLIVRLSFVYGVRGDTDELTGFPAWVRDTLRDGDEVPLFTDQHVSPSRAGSTAAAILELLDAGATGCYHVVSRSCVTPYEFGERIATIQGADASLLRGSLQSDLSRPAPRPSHTCLDVTKLEAELEREQPTLMEDLRAIAAAFD